MDPIGVDGGFNLYGFVGNNPINFVDILGLVKDPACVSDCAQEWLVGCYSGAAIFAAATGGAGTIIGMGAAAHGGAGLPTTPTGRDRALIRNGGPTQYCKNIGAGARAGAAYTAGIGLLSLHAKCLSGYFGCKSGCQDIPQPPKICPPPGPPNCNVNSPSLFIL